MNEQEIVVQNVPLDSIHADSEFNCRGDITPMDVVDLAKDIQERGLIQPVTVAPYSAENAEKYGFKYRLLAGFRRYTAHRVNKSETIPSIIREDMMDEASARFFNLAENIQRANLSLLQEAKALKRLKDLGVPDYDVATRLGKSRGWVQIRYMLLALPEEIQAEVDAGFITQTNVRELYSIFRSAGKDSCFNAAKKLKDAKILGRKARSVNPNKSKPTSKHHRKRPEIFAMMEHIQDSVGNSFATRCLAWCAGEISSNELFRDVKEEAELLNKPYHIPTEEEIRKMVKI
jgi:ParB family chromosome partitioning protein